MGNGNFQTNASRRGKTLRKGVSTCHVAPDPNTEGFPHSGRTTAWPVTAYTQMHLDERLAWFKRVKRSN
jgi:hypothetical protein